MKMSGTLHIVVLTIAFSSCCIQAMEKDTFIKEKESENHWNVHKTSKMPGEDVVNPFDEFLIEDTNSKDSKFVQVDELDRLNPFDISSENSSTPDTVYETMAILLTRTEYADNKLEELVTESKEIKGTLKTLVEKVDSIEKLLVKKYQ